jgi:feruloyl-CoA synthase
MCHWPARDFGGVGLPIPGCEIKLVPDGNKLEMRVRGANVSPGYYNRPDLSAQAFDEEGFFKIGDAVAFLDPDDPERGLRFDGRVSENFKLMSGTWVQVSDIRLSAIAAAEPAIADAVVTGHDREEIGLLVFPNIDGCRRICNAPGASLADLVTRKELHAHVAEALARFNADNPGSSRQVRRALLMSEPPSVDGNEITDKGYINQRSTLERRAGEVARLYSQTPQPDVVIVPRAAKKQTAA